MDNDFIKDFYEEAQDIIQNVYETLEKFNEIPDRFEALSSVTRGVHTIKGSCIMFGMNRLNHVAHDLETYLGHLKDFANQITDEHLSYITRIIDKVSELLQNQDKGNIDDLPVAPPLPSGEIVKKEENPMQPESILNRKNNNEEPIKEIVVGEDLVDHHEMVDPDPNKIVQMNDWKKQEGSAPQSAPQSAPSPTDSPSEGPKINKKRHEEQAPVNNLSEVIRVPVERVNQALDNIWEIFLIRNQLAYLFGQNSSWLGQHPEFVRSWEFLDSSLETNITELESKTMRMRMASLKSIFQRLAQTVRDYSEKHYKPINFQMLGEDTELDKKIIDMLYEPLIHLIRNASDHGIESPVERRKANKDPSGTISVTSKIIGNEVIIEVKDDGKGLDGQKLIQIAKEKGLDLSRVLGVGKDTNEIIFLPGFSTAEEVTDISGRGVGMDAVRTSIHRMGGTIKIESKIGVGTTFILTLPLSMSVVSALVMRVNGQVFACTTNPIIETKIINHADLNHNSGELYFLQRDKYIKCLDLKKSIFCHSKKEKTFIKRDDGAICLVEYCGKEIALLVDNIEEYYSLVIKPIPPNAPKIPFVLGVSILATGEPIFIISLNKLCEFVISGRTKQQFTGGLNYEAA